MHFHQNRTNFINATMRVTKRNGHDYTADLILILYIQPDVICIHPETANISHYASASNYEPPVVIYLLTLVRGVFAYYVMEMHDELSMMCMSLIKYCCLRWLLDDVHDGLLHFRVRVRSILYL